MRRKPRTIEEVRQLMKDVKMPAGPMAWSGPWPPAGPDNSNLTRTARGPFDPDKPWLDQVLDSCPLDSDTKTSAK